MFLKIVLINDGGVVVGENCHHVSKGLKDNATTKSLFPPHVQ
jgi:hypothetical protein